MDSTTAKVSKITGKKFRLSDTIIKVLIYLCAAFCVVVLVGIIGYILFRGLPSIDLGFLTTAPSTLKNTYGILPNIINTLFIIVITIILATPLGIGAAVYLNEYAKKGKIVKIVEFTTETLAGIPSIIYGLFGFVFFCTFLKLQYSIISGSLTLTIMVLPLIIRTTQEALKTVPISYREGALGIGATKWYTIRTILIPSAMRGILTSVILSIGRIVGESAALIFTAGIGTILPKTIMQFLNHPMNSGATLTVQLYQYAGRGENDIAFAVAAVLVIIVFVINIIAGSFGKTSKLDRVAKSKK